VLLEKLKLNSIPKSIDLPAEIKWPSFDTSIMLQFIFGFPQNIIIVGVLLITLVVIHLFIRFNPVFRTYKLLARSLAILVIISSINSVEAKPLNLKDPALILAFHLLGWVIGL